MHFIIIIKSESGYYNFTYLPTFRNDQTSRCVVFICVFPILFIILNIDLTDFYLPLLQVAILQFEVVYQVSILSKEYFYLTAFLFLSALTI